MSEPRITAQARADLEAAWDSVAESNEAAADRLLDTILKQARLHAQFPLMGRPRNDLAANVRSFVVRPYVVFYRPVENTIEVLRVLHGARDIEGIFAEESNGASESET